MRAVVASLNSNNNIVLNKFTIMLTSDSETQFKEEKKFMHYKYYFLYFKNIDYTNFKIALVFLFFLTSTLRQY
jgi:hypothetical protein